jgi:hypothetical protein
MLLRKRKNETNICNPILKKNKVNIISWDEMISASSVRNYMLDDPLIDWLKFYNITNLKSTPRKSNNTKFHTNEVADLSKTFTQYIMEQGIVFEKNIFSYIKETFSPYYKIVQAAESSEARSEEKYNATLQYMKEGVDIIYQGVLHDYTNMLYGCPDLLIRSDRFFDIFNYNINNINIGSPLLSTSFHYVVVDIKHSTLHVAADGIHLLNNDNMPAYKGQILIYNRLLEKNQGYMPECGYIMGKKSNIDSMYTIATVNYTSYDKIYNMKVYNGIKWLKDMRTNGYEWHLLPKPSRSELYPNMKNDDERYNKIKMELSNKINEITSIWQCGYKKRQIAHNKKIYSWKDKRCTPKNLGFNEGKMYTTLNHILDINRKICDSNIRTCDLLLNTEWRNLGDNTMEFYIDFETKYNIGDDTINNMIFMIGIGWEETNIWNYKNFTLEYNTNESELDMVRNMIQFVNDKLIFMNKSESKFIHWTHAEPIFYNKFLNKHVSIDRKVFDISFYDLNKLFLDCNIVVKNATNFKLKTVANAMYKNKMINTCWDSNNICSNGLQAMYMAFLLYRDNERIDPSNPTIKHIINYNMIDCKVMWEILKYLRVNI